MKARHHRLPAAFTLVELLVVMAIIGVLIGLSSLALSSIGRANSLAMSVSNLGEILQQARIYATSNHTYVYVGLQESDSASSNADGTGHVSVMVVASTTGTRPYNSGTVFPYRLTSSQVAPVGKLEVFDNLDLADTTRSANNGNLANRPQPTPNGVINLFDATNKSQVTFQWPLSGTAAHTFNRVIEFDSQGAARLQSTNTYAPTMPSYIEIALLPTHGTARSATAADTAAIQIDGMTGTVRTYRP